MNTLRFAALSTAWRAGLQLLYPQACALCDVELEESSKMRFCTLCIASLTSPTDATAKMSSCKRCAQIVPALHVAEDCAKCRGKKLYFDSAAAMGSYAGDLRAAVLRMKHRAGEQLATAIAGLVVEKKQEWLESLTLDAVAAVPMHWTRRLHRGTNSPELIASVVARKMDCYAELRLLRRRRRTVPQGHLARSKRLKNVRGAFSTSAGYTLQGGRILLVDDVMTTGTTVNQCARALKKSGAARVDVLVVARADTPS